MQQIWLNLAVILGNFLDNRGRSPLYSWEFPTATGTITSNNTCNSLAYGARRALQHRALLPVPLKLGVLNLVLSKFKLVLGVGACGPYY